MQRFCTQHQGTSLADVHQSFSNLDKISALIKKQRLLSYPFGQSIAAVIILQCIANALLTYLQYIQGYYFDGINLLVTCFFKEQVKIILDRESFEIDMGFKRVRDKDINEIVFAAYLPENEKIFTFARVFINAQSSTAYTKAFEALFGLLSSKLEREIRWKHLHGTGFACIVTDMDRGQLQGWGQYLSQIDGSHRPWEWQARNTVMLCYIHFKRSIDRAAGTSGHNTNSIHARMGELVRCESQADYFQLCNELISTSSESVKEWTRHKMQPSIACGLNKHCSMIASEVWERTRNHTNATEQTRFKSNSFGRQLPLLRAIHSSQILDKYDVDRYNSRAGYGISLSWRNTSLSERFAEAIRRDRSRRRESEDDNDGSVDTELLPPEPQRRRVSRSSSSRSSSTRRRGSAQRDTSLALCRMASENILNQSQERQDMELDQTEKQLRIELMREELRQKRLENDRRELENQSLSRGLE
ncbi:hypothetical protein P152DRAFT_413142 [Eremomyces bilateralis CBS 781.70]|uniref:MULE transposase domain-containing protein n=1 Tax=Eremomyces bilateralis CBS 781.70 TaxID=1392243 RepID=A0A6G1G8W9_9PEZI|nr:uncharacterized protein P152DRAFT_413142 [Eremomyces bilateralis CBS 781.70]KAF1814376.1 hypothetical protein P152DRAFT_413142 [Eremomyces bilateralis CBS 781.70]